MIYLEDQLSLITQAVKKLVYSSGFVPRLTVLKHKHKHHTDEKLISEISALIKIFQFDENPMYTA